MQQMYILTLASGHGSNGLLSGDGSRKLLLLNALFQKSLGDQDSRGVLLVGS
jgi:hypothetical protein